MQENNLVLKEILRKIDLAQSKLTKCWEQFVLGSTSEGFNLLPEIFIELENIINFLNSLQEKSQLKINLHDIEELFIQLENAIKLNDYQKIADSIYYDIKNLLKKWRKSINNYIRYKIKGVNNVN